MRESLRKTRSLEIASILYIIVILRTALIRYKKILSNNIYWLPEMY